MDKLFAEIIEEYGGKIYGYLMKLLSSKEDAEDIMQNVFLSFYAKMPTINPYKYSSYLFRTAHNKAINHLKKESKYTPYKELQHIPSKKSDETKEGLINKELINEALKKLKPKEVFALELQLYQKKSYGEIAKIMDTTPSAIDSMLVRTKKKLRKLLQDYR